MRRVTRVAMGFTCLAALAYALFVLNPWRAGDDLWAWALLVMAEVILLANALALWITTLRYDPERAESDAVLGARDALASGRSVVSVDVLITVCGEPLEVVEPTVLAARAMRLPHRTWVCDDGPSEEVRALCARLDVGYLTRPDRRGVKAGNVNEALKRTNGEFVALLDCDHVPHPDFLLVQIPHLLDEDVAFVQGPQSFRPGGGSYVERGSAETQQMFYEAVCPGKSTFNAAFHVGTNAIFRRSALEQVDGFFEDTHSEDIWTSLRLHQRGWRSVYLPHVVARGLGPATVGAFQRQQFRWASGSFEIMLRDNPLQSTALTPAQRLLYFAAPIHFLVSFANVWFMLLPPIYLLFGVEALQADSGTWILWYVPLFLLTQLSIWLQMGLRIRPVVLSMAVAPIHVRAFAAVALRRKPVWSATNQRGRQASPLQLLMPQIALLALNVTGIVVGLAVVLNPVTTWICVGLCLLHVLILGRVILQAGIEQRQADSAGPHPVSPQPRAVAA